MANTFLVERSIVIDATPDKVRALVDNFHQWENWSPYEDLDPKMTRTYSGPDSGVGATYGWSGNNKAGAGTMTVTKSVPGRVELDLAFTKPFKNRNATVFLFEPTGDSTTTTWQMSGTNNVFFRMFGFLINMDKVVGKAFDKGLVNLKAQAEKA